MKNFTVQIEEIYIVSIEVSAKNVMDAKKQALEIYEEDYDPLPESSIRNEVISIQENK